MKKQFEGPGMENSYVLVVFRDVNAACFWRCNRLQSSFQAQSVQVRMWGDSVKDVFWRALSIPALCEVSAS